MSIRKAAASGDRAKALAAIRDKLASDLEDCDPGHAAALAKQLAAVLLELESFAPPERESKVDELGRARAARRAAPKGAPPAGGDLLDGGRGSG